MTKDFNQVNNILWARMRKETGALEGQMLWLIGWIFTLVLWSAWMQGPRSELLKTLGIDDD